MYVLRAPSAISSYSNSALFLGSASARFRWSFSCSGNSEYVRTSAITQTTVLRASKRTGSSTYWWIVPAIQKKITMVKSGGATTVSPRKTAVRIGRLGRCLAEFSLFLAVMRNTALLRNLLRPKPLFSPTRFRQGPLHKGCRLPSRCGLPCCPGQHGHRNHRSPRLLSQPGYFAGGSAGRKDIVDQHHAQAV